MIVTVTLNPSIDRTLRVQALVRGDVLRAEAVEADPGGKGVNVARALSAHGADTVALLVAGGSVGRALVSQLRDAGVRTDVVEVGGSTRTNITVVEPDGTTTKLNEPGPTPTPAELGRVVAAVSSHVSGPADWVVAAGSLPPDVDLDAYARIGDAAHECGARFALDCSGPAFLAGLAAGPDLVKPNREELAEAVGRDLPTLRDIVEACHELQRRGARDVVCSLGGEGALLVSAEGAWFATAPRVEVVNTVGAGDSLLAGFLFAGGAGPEALRVGVAWATAAVGTSGTGVPAPHLVHPETVTVKDASDHTLALWKEVS